MSALLVRLLLLAAGVVLVAPTVAAARAAACNATRARQAFHLAPLANLTSEALEGNRRKPLPDRWPEPATLTDRQVRLAYGRLARDRADNRLLAGEIALIVAGAMAGATIQSVFTHVLSMWAFTVALLVGAVGIILRSLVVARWQEVAERYESP